MYLRALVIIGILGASLSLILGLLSILTLQTVTVLVAVSLGIPSLVLTYEKLKPVSVKPNLEKKEQEEKQDSVTGFRRLTMEEKDILRKETIVVSPTAGYSYEFELLRGDRVKGDISSTSSIDIYFLDDTNFDKWERDKSHEPEDCNEGVLETNIGYEAPRKGIWYVVIENNGRKSATVKVNLSLQEGGFHRISFFGSCV
jgi:hypothetical protein